MKRLLVVLMLAVSALSFGAKVAGVEVAETIKVNEKELVLNGVGIRKKAILNLYVGSLYVEEKTTDEVSVINGENEMSIRLDIVSKLISNDAMKEAVEEGFKASTSNEELASLQDRIDGFVEVFSSEITKGDQFTFDYISGQGIVAYKNGELLITIEGKDFKEALYGIWLGDKPADKKLKDSMMGN